MNKIYTHTDEILVMSLQTGCRLAFQNLYERYSRGIYRHLISMVKNKDDAEEIMQEVFVRLWEKRYHLDPALPVTPYLLRTASNLVYDLYRRVSRDRKLQEIILKTSSELYNHIEEDFLYKESSALVNEAVARLPEQQRKVFILGKLEGKSYKEISELLQIGEATVSTHIVRATKSVKSYLFNAQKGSSLLLALILIFC